LVIVAGSNLTIGACGRNVMSHSPWHLQIRFMPFTPESETYAMMLAGLGLMGAIARRRKAKQG
jgi:hypothetical protein